MKKIQKSKKALSPVVAAIILIAVTVAVSIAVAAWMGSLTIGYMETSELTITELGFTNGDASNGEIAVQVTNPGTSDVTIDYIRVNGETASTWSASTSSTIDSGANDTLTITQTVTTGNKYSVTLYTIDGIMVGSYTATA